jgi:hypothetical protein
VAVWATCGRQQVRFTDYSGKAIPLPNARFLAIHAAIAKVLHFSGAAEPLDLVTDRVLHFSGAAEPLDLVTDRLNFGSSPVWYDSLLDLLLVISLIMLTVTTIEGSHTVREFAHTVREFTILLEN